MSFLSSQILAGTDAFFTFDNVYGVDSSQAEIYDDCVVNLVNGKISQQLQLSVTLKYQNVTDYHQITH